jgi:phosphoglycerate-specific signal transduction histidine kinase
MREKIQENSMQETYIEIMLQSLKKKNQVLVAIMKQNERQKAVLEAPDGAVEDFDETVEAKASLIEQLNQLDSGFEKLYERVREELSHGQEAYADQIGQMQREIRLITDRSMEVQAQEARNKDLMTQKFARVKRQARQVRVNYRATSSYHQSMSGTAFVDPQFMDNKK